MNHFCDPLLGFMELQVAFFLRLSRTFSIRSSKFCNINFIGHLLLSNLYLLHMIRKHRYVYTIILFDSSLIALYIA